MHLKSLESTQEARATITHLSRSPNFPRASHIRTLSMDKFLIWGFRQLRPRRATETPKKQHIHEEFVGKSKSQLFGDHAFWQISLSLLLFCFYSVLARFEHQKIVINKWNTIIRVDEVCKQLVFTKFSELRFHFFCNVL